MQPNQPLPPANPNGDGQFDFILNGDQKAKKGLLPRTNSRKQRLFVALGGGLVIVALVAIVLSLVLSSGSSPTEDLVSVVQTQNEIVRISSTGSQKARSQAAQSFATTIAVSTTSGQLETTKYLATKKVKVTPKVLALGQNPKTDLALNSAEAAGRYDEELISTLNKSMISYRTQVSTAYKAAKTKAQKTLLQQLFDQTTIILKNQPAATSS